METKKTTTTYGIRCENGKVKAVSRFEGEMPQNFKKISAEDYAAFLEELKANPYSTYDSVQNVLVANPAKLQLAEKAALLRQYRTRLKELASELDLAAKLGDDPGEGQAAFERLKTEYMALKGT